jgi:hypothetical protein
MAFVPLDQVLGLASDAISGFIKPLRAAFGEVGDDIPDIGMPGASIPPSPYSISLAGS